MGNLFDYDGKLAYAVRKVADFIIASVLWVVGCIPLITIGTSTTALYYASMKGVLKEGSVAKNFWKSYKENLKQSVLAELILLVIAYIMYLNWQIIFEMSGGGTVWKVVYIVVLLWMIPIVCYIFPLLSKFVLSTKMLFVNAFVLSFQNLPKTLCIVLTTFSPIVCLVIRMDYVIRILPVLVLVVPGVLAYLNAMWFVKIFEQYTEE